MTNINPKLSSSIRQQTPFTFGQNGFGADIAGSENNKIVGKNLDKMQIEVKVHES